MSARTRIGAVLVACMPLALAFGCGHEAPVDASVPRPRTTEGDASTRADAQTTAVVDAGWNFTPPSQIVVLGTWVPIRREPHRDAALLGYMRAGAVTRVEGYPVGREHCPVRRDDPSGGWYHVAGGGFVCVGGSLAVAWPARGTRRPTQPMLDAGMPYEYAAVYGSPIMYRAPPTMDELRIYEAWRFRHDEPEAGTSAEVADNTADPNAAPATTTTVAADPPEPDTDTQAAPTAHANDRHAAAADPPAPGPPPTTSTDTPSGEPRLRDLRGDRSGPVIRRLLRGMYLALDRSVLSHSTGDRYWRTQSGGFVRTGPLSMVHNVSTFRGVIVDATHTLPFAFMVSTHGYNYRLSANGRSASEHDSVDRLTPIQLTQDPPVEIGTRTFYRTADGLAVDARNVRIARVRPPPQGLADNEKWIDVDLDEQVLVAYEGTRPVFVTLVSTGRRREGENNPNYETPAGAFRIRGKHITTTMDGDTASDGPYSIEDVPWAMYFYESYALHGAFWHGNYGWRMSHGCVNMSPGDANWLFFWTDPQLPDGWHGVFATPEHPGTRVELHHGDRPTPRRPTL